MLTRHGHANDVQKPFAGALSEDETTFLLWFDARVKSPVAGDERGKIRVNQDPRVPLPFDAHLFEASADLVDKGLLKATHQSFGWCGPKGGGLHMWWDLEMTEAGAAAVRRIRRRRRWQWLLRLWPVRRSKHV